MKKRIVAALIISCILLGGCGKEAVKVPELKEPVSISESCCSVETGILEIPEMDFATVLPTKYKQCFLRDMEIQNIAVEYGDMVKEGDVLATADTGDARQRLKEAKAQYQYNEQSFAITEEIYQYRIGQQAKLKKNDKAFRLLKEDFRYEREQYSKQQEELKKEQEKQEKIIEAGTLRASRGGMVTSVVSLGNQEIVGAGKMVVEISDLDDPVLEMHGHKYTTYYDSLWKKKYILVGDIEVPVKLLPYDVNTINEAAKEGIGLLVRYTVREKDKHLLTMGNVYPVYLFENKKSEGLRIPEEAVYEDREKSYVYVKTEAGRQRRDISCKAWKNTNWVEVTEGLNEGEQVYCRYSSGMPDGTETEQAEKKEVSIKSRSRATSRVVKEEISQGVESSGRIAKVFVEKGDTVKKGAPLFQMEGVANEARLLELRYQKENLQKSRRASEKTYKKALKGAETELDRKLLALERRKQLRSEEEELKGWEAEYQKAVKEAEGEKITAQAKGTVQEVKVKAGDMAEAGMPCVTIARYSGKLISVVVNKNVSTEPSVFDRWNAQIGTAVSIVTMGKKKDRKKSQGICVGSEPGNIYQYYFRQTGNTLSHKQMLHAAADFSYISLPSALWVPKGLIYGSSNVYEKQGSYVWRLTEGGPVKQYVLVNGELVADGKVMVLYGLKEGDILCLE